MAKTEDNKSDVIPGPYTLLRYPANLEEVTGKPTGQGFGASVVGTPHDPVCDVEYPQGESFETSTNDVPVISG